MKSARTLIILCPVVLVLGLFTWWVWPKSHTLSCSSLHTGYYRGFGITGAEGPLFGKRYYRITVNLPGEWHSRVKYKHAGYNDFKRFYPDGALAEEGQCMVEPYGSPEPIPDEHDVLWSKCYRPNGTLCSEVKNGTGTQMCWTPQGIKIWELELVNFERVRHTIWHANGQLCQTQAYVDGLVDGPFVSYYPSGQKQTEGAYSKGDRAGKWIRYNEDGSISKTEDYTNSPERSGKISSD